MVTKGGVVLTSDGDAGRYRRAVGSRAAVPVACGSDHQDASLPSTDRSLVPPPVGGLELGTWGGVRMGEWGRGTAGDAVG